VDVIRASNWYRGQEEFSTLHNVVDELTDSTDSDEFNQWLDELYDLADYDRIWLG
jgi:hypothetical protein